MNVVITGGGTAGHIYPALALADELTARGAKVYYAGTPAGAESRLVPAAGYEYVAFDVSGFDRSRPWTALTALRNANKSKARATSWLKEIDANLVVGFGGYVSVPVVHTAQKLGIKTAIHEQNSVMGLANEELSKHADAVCLTYESAANKVKDKSKVVVTGNPVRKEVLSATREEGISEFGLSETSEVFLVFGGSLGAKTINETIVKLKDQLLSVDGLEIIHVAGKRDYDWVCECLKLNEDEKKRYHLLDYCYEMPKALACADVILSRAGATSLAEISARKIPALLVPFPHATADHQTKNAESYVDAGAAYWCKDDEVGSVSFLQLLFDIIKNKETREKMKIAAESFGTVDATARLADTVIQLIK